MIAAIVVVLVLATIAVLAEPKPRDDGKGFPRSRRRKP